MGLGQSFPNKPESVQDAFHSPCICVQNLVGLRPGDYVRFTDTGWSEVIRVPFGIHHGVVDPFVQSVAITHWVNVLLKPDLIGRLYHNFEMPANVQMAPTGWEVASFLGEKDEEIVEVKIPTPVVGEHFKDEIRDLVKEILGEEEDTDDWCTVERC